MKLSIALAAAFAGSAAAVYSPPQPKGGQDIMSLWMQLEVSPSNLLLSALYISNVAQAPTLVSVPHLAALS